MTTNQHESSGPPCAHPRQGPTCFSPRCCRGGTRPIKGQQGLGRLPPGFVPVPHPSSYKGGKTGTAVESGGFSPLHGQGLSHLPEGFVQVARLLGPSSVVPPCKTENVVSTLLSLVRIKRCVTAKYQVREDHCCAGGEIHCQGLRPGAVARPALACTDTSESCAAAPGGHHHCSRYNFSSM